MDSGDIMRALTRLNGLVPARRYVCCPNVSWSMLPWEADLIAMSESGYLTEVEIKISHSDLKRDMKKAKHQRVNGWGSDRIKFFYYAMPAKVHALAEAAGTLDLLPAHAGVVVVERGLIPNGHSDRCVVKKIAEAQRARPMRDGEKLELYRLISFRYWDMVTRG